MKINSEITLNAPENIHTLEDNANYLVVYKNYADWKTKVVGAQWSENKFDFCRHQFVSKNQFPKMKISDELPTYSHIVGWIKISDIIIEEK